MFPLVVTSGTTSRWNRENQWRQNEVGYTSPLKPVMIRLILQSPHYLTCWLCYHLDHGAIKNRRLNSPNTNTDNHVGNQANGYHPCPTEVDGRIYIHRRSPNWYRHHWHLKTAIDRLNEEKIWRSYFNTQPLQGHSPNGKIQAYILEGRVFNPDGHRTIQLKNWQGRNENRIPPSRRKA